MGLQGHCARAEKGILGLLGPSGTPSRSRVLGGVVGGAHEKGRGLWHTATGPGRPSTDCGYHAQGVRAPDAPTGLCRLDLLFSPSAPPRQKRRAQAGEGGGSPRCASSSSAPSTGWHSRAQETLEEQRSSVPAGCVTWSVALCQLAA